MNDKCTELLITTLLYTCTCSSQGWAFRCPVIVCLFVYLFDL